MPAIAATYTINGTKGGAAANLVFTTVNPQNGSSNYQVRNVVPGVYDQQQVIFGSLLRNQGTTRANRVKLQFLYPIVRTNAVTGVTSVVDTSRVDIDYRISDLATADEREHLATLVGNLLSSPLVLPMAKDLATLY